MQHSTQNTLNFLTNLAEWFLLMPLNKLNKNFVRFRWYSWKTVTILIATIFSLTEVLLFLNYMSQQQKKFSATSGLAFYATVFIYKIMFIDIARKWPNLMTKWNELDFLMINYPITENYLLKMKMVSLVLFILSLGEHLFFTATLGIFMHGLPFIEELRLYLSTIFKFVFIVLPYNVYLGLFVQILNWLWTIVWNYVDGFLIALFISFAFRQKQIERKVAMLIHNKIQGEIYWKETREHFVKLTDLCREMENCISPLILVSFANKLFVVLYQLMGILSGELASNENNNTNVVLNRLYYTFSFIFILLRLVGVIFFASAIDVKNHEILCNLFSVPSEVYNTEIDRFITSIRVTPPVISGAKFFAIKRSLILKIASSIIVYELVIMKFKSY